MKRTEVISFIILTCSYLRLSQAKTLSNLVEAAMKVTRASLAELRRALSYQNGVATKHSIKRVNRFVGNRRIETTEAIFNLARLPVEGIFKNSGFKAPCFASRIEQTVFSGARYWMLVINQFPNPLIPPPALCLPSADYRLSTLVAKRRSPRLAAVDSQTGDPTFVPSGGPT